MKKGLFYLIAIIIVAIGFHENLSAQKTPVQPVGCIDMNIRAQANGIKQHYVAQGFTVYRDAMINMSSLEPFPIVVQLVRGQLYEIIFVGQPAATNHKMVLYDGADNMIDERFIARRQDIDQTNYFVYEFVPDRTDVYMLTFMTRLKNKNFCGSVCIVTADQSKRQIRYKPYRPGVNSQ